MALYIRCRQHEPPADILSYDQIFPYFLALSLTYLADADTRLTQAGLLAVIDVDQMALLMIEMHFASQYTYILTDLAGASCCLGFLRLLCC